MMSYDQYSEEQKNIIKRRNKVVGQMRHYDEIVSMRLKRFTVQGFLTDRTLEEVFKQEYYQTIDGSPWKYPPVDVVRLALDITKTRTDFPIGAAPPGYHLAQWAVKQNPDFELHPLESVDTELNGCARK